jgi:hypothetical protein
LHTENLDIHLDTNRIGVCHGGYRTKESVAELSQAVDQARHGRFEVFGLDSDRDLIRSLAKRLAEDDPDAVQIRATVSRTIGGEPPKKGGILAALRRSPLAGANLDLARSRDTGRKVDL